MVVRSASAVSPWWIVSAKMLITSAASGPNEVRTQHTLSLLLDENLEAVRRLGNATGRIPVEHLLGVRAESPSAHVRFCLAQPNRGNGRHCVGSPTCEPLFVPAGFDRGDRENDGKEWNQRRSCHRGNTSSAT